MTHHGKNLMRRGVIKDEDFYEGWSRLHDYCMACGIGNAKAAFRDGGISLSTHHIIKPGRSDERCNLLRLCRRDHDLAELLTVTVSSVALPTLPIAVCLTIKKLREPHDHDPERLAELYGVRLPDPQPIPAFLAREWARRRGSHKKGRRWTPKL